MNPVSEPIIVRAACPHDCPDTCALLVTVKDGVATEVKGDPDHPTTAGVLCTKVSRYTERTYHKDRLLHPMKRVGTADEIANAIVWLLSDEASYVTSTILDVSGGR